MFNRLRSTYGKHQPTTASARIQELLEKIDADRLLYQADQDQLLALLSTHRREMLGRFDNLKASFMETASPPPPPPAAGGAAIARQIEAATCALGSLRALASAQDTISRLYPQARQTHLGDVSALVAGFIDGAAALHGRCVREQDLLVPACMEWYAEQAGSVCARTPRPRELVFRLNGLPRVLQDLCWCSGEGCMHVIVPDQGDCGVVSVSVVHPGASWDGLRRCMFAAIKAVTLLDGEIFGLVTTAVVREKWGVKVFDAEMWKEEWRDVSEVDVFWPVPGDDEDDGEYSLVSGSSVRRSVRTLSLGSPNSKDMWGIYYKTSPESKKESPASVGSGVKPEPTTSSKASSRSSESIPGILKSGSSTKSGSGSTVRFASTTSPPPGAVKERESHSHLRRRVGSASLRAPSFLSPMKDDKQSQTATVTHPYLKRGAGANRKSMPALK